MPEYKIKIPNENRNAYQLVNLIILFVNFLLFSLSAIYTEGKLSYVAFFGIIISSVAIGWHFKFRKMKPMSRLPLFFLLITALTWLTLQRWMAAILMLAFAIMEFFINREQEILFAEDGIIYPSFPARTFRWEDVEQVLIRDGILTIDMKDNRLLQFSLADEELAQTDVAGFNEFCRKKQGRSA